MYSPIRIIHDMFWRLLRAAVNTLQIMNVERSKYDQPRLQFPGWNLFPFNFNSTLSKIVNFWVVIGFLTNTLYLLVLIMKTLNFESSHAFIKSLRLKYNTNRNSNLLHLFLFQSRYNGFGTHGFIIFSKMTPSQAHLLSGIKNLSQLPESLIKKIKK